MYAGTHIQRPTLALIHKYIGFPSLFSILHTYTFTRYTFLREMKPCTHTTPTKKIHITVTYFSVSFISVPYTQKSVSFPWASPNVIVLYRDNHRKGPPILLYKVFVYTLHLPFTILSYYVTIRLFLRQFKSCTYKKLWRHKRKPSSLKAITSLFRSIVALF